MSTFIHLIGLNIADLTSSKDNYTFNIDYYDQVFAKDKLILRIG